MTKLNILVLHRLGDPCAWRESMVEKELCLPKFAPEHNYFVHDFWLPMPSHMKNMDYDAIVLTQTFLGCRLDGGMRARIESEYGELLRGLSFKIALPQDDYTCSGILDRWLCDWNVDLVYPVCSNNWEVLYPLYSKVGRLKQGFTGYINEELVARTENFRLVGARTVDVAYRAANLRPEFGRLGQIKVEYGDRFLKAVSGLSLNNDISTRPQDVVLGERWYDFIENTRCMLGVNSGSSLLDPEGSISEHVYRYLQRRPSASFEEVEAVCFPGQEGQYEFTAISPRNLECALFGAVQILAPGAYSGFLQPWEHYIPLEPDMSNISEVIPLLSDHAFLQAMAYRCRAAVLSFPELRYRGHAAELINEIKGNTRLSDSARAKNAPVIEFHQRELVKKIPDYWRKKRLMTKARQALGDIGLRRLKYWLKDQMAEQMAKMNS